MVLPALKEENLAKIEEENNKKFECSLAKSKREREKVEKLLKKMFEIVKELFLKNLKYDRKTSLINRTRQRLTEFLKQDFD